MESKTNKTAKRQMLHPTQILLRYKSFVFQKYKQHYLDSQDRDEFLEVIKKPLLAFLLSVLNDSYQQEINTIWQQGFHLKKKLPDILKQIETIRVQYEQQQFLGIEYNQPYEPVDEFVEENNPKEIIKFLIRCGVGNYFFSVIGKLEQARKRGGLHEREELAIIRRVEENSPQLPVHSRSQVGFKWVGLDREKRIKNLYGKLHNRGYVDKQTSLEQFDKLFSDSPVEQPVIWLKTSVQLLYMIDRLLDSGLIKLPEELENKRSKRKTLLKVKNRGEDTPQINSELKQAQHYISTWLYERMEACFINKAGKPYTGKQLKHTRNELDNKNGIPKTATEIDSILSTLA